MKKVLTGLQVAEGKMLPKWYGIAYFGPCSDCYVAYPIPINLIVRFVRRILWAIKRPSKKLEAVHKAYDHGYYHARDKLMQSEAAEQRTLAGILRELGYDK